MSNPSTEISKFAAEFLLRFPASVTDSLLADASFKKELGIATEGKISFGGSNVTFSRNNLFLALREAFSITSNESRLIDEKDQEWTVKLVSKKELPKFRLTSEKNSFEIEQFWALMPDVDRRLSIFKAVARERNFSQDDLEYWTPIMGLEEISDDQVSDLLSDIEACPRYVEDLLKVEFQSATNELSALVPETLRYYERLIGKHISSEDIIEYSEKELRIFLHKNDENEIQIYDLLILHQSNLSKVLSENSIKESKYRSFCEYALQISHPTLILACFELGINKFPDSCADIIEKLFYQLESSEIAENLYLFCALVIFIDGELSRLQLFHDTPPYYRRLAALSHSSLILKVALDEGVRFQDLETWAQKERGLNFYCQSFVDLRTEPRWLPNYLSDIQLKHELYGRVYISCQEKHFSVTNKVKVELQDKSFLPIQSFLPGPLEGRSQPAKIPSEINSILDQCLVGEASIDTFKALINSAPFWEIEDKHLSLAVTLLENAEHQLKQTDNKESAYQILNGLAQVACLARSKQLASSLVILSRIYRDYLSVDEEPENFLALGLVAAAAFNDKDEWADFFGQWVTELVDLDLAKETLLRIRLMLEKLCVIEPYLFYSCSRSLEILKVLNF